MTASFTLLLPMLGACFAAMAVPTVLRHAPIYDARMCRKFSCVDDLGESSPL
jgi:H+/Cl- antiporter ClcA